MTRKTVRGRKLSKPSQEEAPHKSTLRAVRLKDGMPPLPNLIVELEDMRDVLLGRTPPPINKGTLTLMEVASAYHARALEITMELQRAEREGTVLKGSAHYKFRTGELRTFTDIAKAAAELGSRRLSSEQLEFDQARYGRDL